MKMPAHPPYNALMGSAKPIRWPKSGWKTSATFIAYLVQKMPIISNSGTALPGARKRRAAACLAALATPLCGMAQEIPYGVRDAQKLQAIVQEAQSHLGEPAWLKAAGIASHQLAALKVDGASDKAVAYLKKLAELEPDNAETLAYLGSAYAMAGRDSGFVGNKISNVNKGLAALDKAVKKAPDNLMVRFTRASVCYNLPAMFSRKEMAQVDYQFFVDHAQASAQTNDMLAEAYYKLGQLAQDKDQKTEARNFYAQAQKAAPQSDWAR